jgi:hypothetical protein
MRFRPGDALKQYNWIKKHRFSNIFSVRQRIEVENMIIWCILLGTTYRKNGINREIIKRGFV